MHGTYDREYESLYKTMNAYSGRREAKIALAAATVLVFVGFAIGAVLYSISGIDIDGDLLISGYFDGMFASADSVGEKIGIVLACFYHEVAFPTLVFISGYTVFAPLFASAICVTRATICAFSVCMLEFTSRGGIFIESLIFLICQIALISIDVSIAVRAYFHSISFCSRSSSISDILKRGDSRAYFFDFIISAGVLFTAVTLTIVLINLI